MCVKNYQILWTHSVLTSKIVLWYR